jgi:hypothetical protein
MFVYEMNGVGTLDAIADPLCQSAEFIPSGSTPFFLVLGMSEKFLPGRRALDELVFQVA